MANQGAFREFVLRGVQVTENEFGHGSYAVVVELRYRGLKCAGKKLYRVLYQSGIGHAARRYLEECRLLSQTRHPHIVQFIGVHFEEGSQFPILVMEFLPTNLSSCLERYGILSDEISYSILHEVSLGLTYLHGQTPVIVHRDLSANNILLSSNMTAKISDLGVARILNLTPLQVSRMTETPGTPAYMPPEVMVADPRYDTSVDVFSFGVMMLHTFTAEWPLPKVGQTRIDPTNPDRLLPVTEAERREEFLQKVVRDHPLMDLIMRCLSNNPQRRPRAEEIVGRMGDVVLQYPPSFENRVEMLQRISTLDTEKTELEQEIVRKDSTIEEKAGEVERLREEKRQRKEESEGTIESIKLASLIEVEQKQTDIVDLRGQLSSVIASKDATIAAKDAIINSKDAIIAAKEAEVAAKESSLQRKEAAVQSMSAQLEMARDYLTSKPQPSALQVGELSYSKCSNSPVKMSGDVVVSINDKVYYGGGACEAQSDEYFVHCYTPSQDVWTTLPRLPVRWFGMGKVNDELVTVGGSKGIILTSSKTSEVHTLSNGMRWTRNIPPMPTARGAPTVVSLPTHLVVAGGEVARGQVTDIVEIYNINTSQWSKTDSLPYACDDMASAVCNDTVYLANGWDGKNHVKKVVTAHIDKLISNLVPAVQLQDNIDHNSAWKEIASPPCCQLSTVVMSDMVLAVGGMNKDGGTYKRTDRVYAYSSSMDSWVYFGDLPSPRSGAATVALSPTEFLVIGGVEKGLRLNTVYKAMIIVFLK